MSVRERFAPAVRPAVWAHVSDDDWNDWRWHQRNRIKTVHQLQALGEVSLAEVQAIEATSSAFRMAITPYYASLMTSSEHCPIRQQAVPQLAELHTQPWEMEDPLAEEAHMPVPGITHRYPDRVLFYTTHNCPVYCRHCTRKRKVSYPETAAGTDQLQLGLDYIRRTPVVRDVLVSGGDPLSLSDERLDWLLTELRAISHVEIIRLSTRNLVTLPQRVTPRLAQILSKVQPVFVQTHFNHPAECTREAWDACDRLANAGSPINNQMVLLRGVNDDPETVRELNRRLVMMRVRPYYLFLADMAQGISHFRTPVAKGIEVIEKLRGWSSGLMVPHYVIDLPGGGGKVALVPESIKESSPGRYVFKNYQGRSIELHEPVLNWEHGKTVEFDSKRTLVGDLQHSAGLHDLA